MISVPNFTPDQLLNLYLLFHGFKSRTLSPDPMGRFGKIHYFSKLPKTSQLPEKETLVFLHGIGATSAHYAKVMVPLAKMGHPVFALDLPSHGLSSEMNVSLNSESMIKAFSSWVNQTVPVQRFILIGNSLGGALALKYACEFSSRVKKLLLISPAGGFPSQKEWNAFVSGLKTGTPASRRDWVERIFHQKPIYLPLLVQPFMKAMSRKGIQELLELTRHEDLVYAQEFLNCLPPTLMIWGKSEAIFDRSHLEQFKKDLPAWVQFEEPEGIGHCPQLDQPQWLVKRIQEFLNKNDD